MSNARVRNIGWRIDYCLGFIDLSKKIINADICNQIERSDHSPVRLMVNRSFSVPWLNKQDSCGGYRTY